MVVALEVAEDNLKALIVDLLHMLQRFEAAICNNLLPNERIFELAEIFEEGRTNKCLLILIDGYLCDLQYKIEKEEWYLLDITAEYLEEIA